jgi:hypothetical protein
MNDDEQRTKRCETCKWWEKNVVQFEDPEGFCHRHPPLRDRQDDSDWSKASGYINPITYHDNFCGEWTAAPQPTCEQKTTPGQKKHYHPIETPHRYPLELNRDLHIYLWSESGKTKWTIAYFIGYKEGYNLHFVGDRPLDSRVNWDHFRELVAQGQKIANEQLIKDANPTQ